MYQWYSGTTAGGSVVANGCTAGTTNLEKYCPISALFLDKRAYLNNWATPTWRKELFTESIYMDSLNLPVRLFFPFQSQWRSELKTSSIPCNVTARWELVWYISSEILSWSCLRGIDKQQILRKTIRLFSGGFYWTWIMRCMPGQVFHINIDDNTVSQVRHMSCIIC